MKFSLNFFCFYFSLIFSSYAFGKYKVELINQTKQDLIYNHTYEISSIVPSFAVLILEAKKKTHIQDNEAISFNNFRISFYDTEQPCSLITFFGVDYPHGWGLTIKINGKEMGTICANKKMLVDPTIQARLEYFKNDNEDNYLRFSNIGWWQNSDKLPRTITIPL
ncbi:hypothetical protein ACWNT8_15160 [Pigmentibacter ruber]|uniref:hypothetical protein n=1 Tax=Pigmentibacter ruber TaxID=2683196 RepID=UPI00131C7128|nr:hypothetical protein [Pigmentibacter ruber]BFD31365.1 hypothetical protein GTC16762_09830 [Pigmentibacter ruber]